MILEFANFSCVMLRSLPIERALLLRMFTSGAAVRTWIVVRSKAMLNGFGQLSALYKEYARNSLKYGIRNYFFRIPKLGIIRILNPNRPNI